MYLQPIFDSPDIMKQLHYENKKFKSVDKMWRKIILKVEENPNVLIACNREGLFADFKDANESLERVQRGLNEYLEQKRSIFARFYFLSNSDLLEILSQTKEVENVRPHLRKVFESMDDLEFRPDKTIHAMFSGEGEKINFDSQVDPNNKGVEWWMGEVEDAMTSNVRLALLRSINDYKERERT
jgi:dynein heavy chain